MLVVLILLILRFHIIVPYCAETIVLEIYIDHFVRFFVCGARCPGNSSVFPCSSSPRLPRGGTRQPRQTASREVHSAEPPLFPASAFTPTGVSDRVGSGLLLQCSIPTQLGTSTLQFMQM